MDEIFGWIQAKLGPVTFGATLGFVLQIVVFRPTNWILAAERAVAAIAMPMLFAKPLIPLAERFLPGIDQETSVIFVSGMLALGGTELLRAMRKRLVNTAGGTDD